MRAVVGVCLVIILYAAAGSDDLPVRGAERDCGMPCLLQGPSIADRFWDKWGDVFCHPSGLKILSLIGVKH